MMSGTVWTDTSLQFIRVEMMSGYQQMKEKVFVPLLPNVFNTRLLGLGCVMVALTEAAKEQIGKTPLGRKMRFWWRSGILSLLDILSRENVLVLEAVLIATKFLSILITSETVILNWMHQLGRMNVD